MERRTVTGTGHHRNVTVVFRQGKESAFGTFSLDAHIYFDSNVMSVVTRRTTPTENDESLL